MQKIAKNCKKIAKNAKNCKKLQKIAKNCNKLQKTAKNEKNMPFNFVKMHHIRMFIQVFVINSDVR